MTARVYPLTRYEPSALVDVVSLAARERLSPSALKAFFAMIERWDVRDEDARALEIKEELRAHADRSLMPAA